MTKPTDEAAKLARDILADISKVRYTELERPGAPEVQNGLREIIAKRIAKHLADKDAEIERLRELAHRVVVSTHLRIHGGLNQPNFDKCRYGFCADWHDLQPQEPTNEN